MNPWPRILILLLAAAGFIAVREYVLLTTEPQQLTDLALEQMRSDDQASHALRAANSCKNWWHSGWILLLWLFAATLALFGWDLRRLWRRQL